ncbi:hypothetical protein BU16DRAFT_541496 [Lophium mytilinum]|uniref:BTB domain-containing protein n=1 Tax=Lophium mytilinum TaxID=390894 RepID=A0A6A6QJR3_9PEZI|nr:hypothetical protein BU16DRAFT_541496 [Lophium mytilinum]
MAAEASASLKGFRKGIRSLYTTEHYSDLAIVCRKDTYEVQKAVICPRSAVFAKALRGPGKESEEVEIDLSVEDPKMLERMICFFYHLDYLPTSPNSFLQRHSGQKKEYISGMCPCVSSLEEHDIDLAWRRGTFCVNHTAHNVLKIHALMYAMGDKYGCSDLKIIARAKFEAFLDCSSGCSEVARVIPIVFGTTPDSDLGLRNLIVEEIVKKDYLAFEAMENAVGKTDGLPLAILKAMNSHSIK